MYYGGNHQDACAGFEYIGDGVTVGSTRRLWPVGASANRVRDIGKRLFVRTIWNPGAFQIVRIYVHRESGATSPRAGAGATELAQGGHGL
jgi:hypothetical protein